MKKMKITALGDSLTRGVVLNEKNRYSVLDGSFIDIISKRFGLDIINYGKFGCTIDFGQRVIERHAGEVSASDYILLEFGGNDYGLFIYHSATLLDGMPSGGPTLRGIYIVFLPTKSGLTLNK